MAETTNEIPWDAFEKNDAWIKPEVNRKYRFGFKSIGYKVQEFPEKDKAGNILKNQDGTDKLKKTPTLVLIIDQIDGVGQEKEWQVTAKELSNTIRSYLEAGILYTSVFEYIKTGTDMKSTRHALLNMGPKQAPKITEVKV